MSVEVLKKKNEAIKRMQLLKLDKNMIHDFQQNDLIWVSNGSTTFRVTRDHTIINEIIERLKNEYDTLVYHILYSDTNFGTLLSFLTVSPYSEEWQFEKDDIRDGIVFSWVENLSEPCFSEFGSISIENKDGVLKRVY